MEQMIKMAAIPQCYIYVKGRMSKAMLDNEHFREMLSHVGSIEVRKLSCYLADMGIYLTEEQGASLKAKDFQGIISAYV